MKRDIRKAVEEIKSAGMEEFLHQDPSTFEYDDYSSQKCDKHSRGHQCRTKCRCPRTKCTRVKKCTFVTKCVRYEKKHYWTKRCYCKKCVFYPNNHGHHQDHSSHHHDDCHDQNSNRKKKKYDYWWYRKRHQDHCDEHEK